MLALLVSVTLVLSAPVAIVFAESIDEPLHGTYSIRYKTRGVRFRDSNNVYSEYWLAFIGNTYGFHDASWQPRFGGDWYLAHGSKGCVNMPTWAAKQLYETCPIGVEVRIHY